MIQPNVIKDQILVLINFLKTETDQETAIEKFSQGLTDIIVEAIKSGQVTEATFTVTGTCVTPSGGGTIAGVATQNILGTIN